MDAISTNTDLLRSNVNIFILTSLEHFDRYGYDILKEIEDKSQGAFKLKQPTLYSCLKRLEKQGLITSYWGEESNGGRRRYYSLSEAGKDLLNNAQESWAYTRTLLDTLVTDKEVDLSSAPAPYNTEELKPLTRRQKVNVIEEEDEDDDDEEEEKAETAVQPKAVENVFASGDISEKVKAITTPIQTFKDIKKEDIHVEEPEEIGSLRDLFKAQQKEAAASIAPPQITEEKKKEEEPKEEIASLKEITAVIDREAMMRKSYASKVLSENINPKYEEVYTHAPEAEVISNKQTLDNQKKKDASRLLGIGEFYDPNAELELKSENRTVEASLSKNPIDFSPVKNIAAEHDTHNKVEKIDINYQELLDDLLFSKNPETRNFDNAKEEPVISKSIHYNDLKNTLFAEGYKLREYDRTNSDQYYKMNYIHNNKLNKDVSLIMYLFIVIELLVALLCDRFFGFGYKVYIGLIAGALIIPIYFITVYFLNPNKRIKANFNFNLSIFNKLIIFCFIFLVSTIICVLTGVSFKDGEMYLPWILALNFPISSLIYALLYNSKKYHLQ